MKRILCCIMLLTALLVCLVGCEKNAPTGGDDSEITGCIAYFYGEEETAIESFYSEDKEPKQIELSKENTYTIGFRPSFRGSKEAVYHGDCATFSFADDCCEITYIGEKNSHPLYELKIKTDSDFDLTIAVDGYTQTVKIIVASVLNSDNQILFEDYFDVISTLDIFDIKNVKSAKYAGSTSPHHRAPVEHKSSTLNADVEAVYTWLKGLENNIALHTGELSEGGSSVCLTVYTSVGTLVLWESADGLLLIGENYYVQNNRIRMPVFEGERLTYTFESYFDDAKVYIDGIQIGITDFAFEDIVCERIDAEPNERLFWMDTCIGTVDVFGSRYFTRGVTTYKIISGPDFSSIIHKFFTFDESTRVNYEADHDSHAMGYGNDNHLYPNTYVFYSLSGFREYCDNEGLTRVRDRINSLDGKMLIVVEFLTGNSADSLDVADVGVNGDILTIRFTEPANGDADGMTAAWVHYAIVIVDKDDFSGDAQNIRLVYNLDVDFENTMNENK